MMRSMCRTVLLALLSVLALSAVAASAAQAEEAPYFKVAGKRLAKGETTEVISRTRSGHPIGITTETAAFDCHMTYAPGAKLVGSNAGEPGTAELTFEFSKCETVSLGHEGCKVIDEPIKSVPLKAMLVNIAESKKKTKRLGIFYLPVKGEKFMTVHMSSQCRVKEENFTGDLAAQIRTAGAGEVEVGKEVEEGKEPVEEKAFESYFTDPPIGQIWEMRGGEGKLEGVSLSRNLLITNASTLELASGSLWGVFD